MGRVTIFVASCHKAVSAACGIVCGLVALMVVASATSAAAQDLLWESRPGFRDFGSFAVANGVVVSGAVSGGNGLVGIDAATGKVLWKGTQQLASGPASDGTRAYAAVRVDQLVHRIVALEPKTGKVIWSVEGTRYGGTSSILVNQGRLFIVGLDGNTRAFDAATGKPLWTFQYSREKGYCPSGIVADGNRVLFVGGESSGSRSQGINLWSIDAATGKEAWRFAFKPERYSTIGECLETPAVANGVVAVTGSNQILGLDASTGHVIWKQEVVGMVDGFEKRRPLGAPHISNGQVYAIFEEGLYGWDLATGKPGLKYAGHFAAPPNRRDILSADGILYFTANFEEPESKNNRQGFLYAFNPTSKQVLWKHRVNRPNQISSIANWSTDDFLIDGNAIYYENHQLLAKIRR